MGGCSISGSPSWSASQNRAAVDCSIWKPVYDILAGGRLRSTHHGVFQRLVEADVEGGRLGGGRRLVPVTVITPGWPVPDLTVR